MEIGLRSTVTPAIDPIPPTGRVVSLLAEDLESAPVEHPVVIDNPSLRDDLPLR
jgi:hypothetical protein